MTTQSISSSPVLKADSPQIISEEENQPTAPGIDENVTTKRSKVADISETIQQQTEEHASQQQEENPPQSKDQSETKKKDKSSEMAQQTIEQGQQTKPPAGSDKLSKQKTGSKELTQIEENAQTSENKSTVPNANIPQQPLNAAPTPDGKGDTKTNPTEESSGLSWVTIALSTLVGVVVGAAFLCILLLAGEIVTTTMIVLFLAGGALAGIATGVLISLWKSDDDNKQNPPGLSLAKQKAIVTDGKTALGELSALLPGSTSAIDSEKLTAINAKLENFQAKLENLSNASPLFAGLPKIEHGLTANSTKDNISGFASKLNAVDEKFAALTKALDEAENATNVDKAAKGSDVLKAYSNLHTEIVKLPFETLTEVPNSENANKALGGKLLGCVTSQAKNSKEWVDFFALMGIFNGARKFDAARAAYELTNSSAGQVMLSMALKRIAGMDKGIPVDKLEKEILQLKELVQWYDTKSGSGDSSNPVNWAEEIKEVESSKFTEITEEVASLVLYASAAKSASEAAAKKDLENACSLACRKISLELSNPATKDQKKQEATQKFNDAKATYGIKQQELKNAEQAYKQACDTALAANEALKNALTSAQKQLSEKKTELGDASDDEGKRTAVVNAQKAVDVEMKKVDKMDTVKDHKNTLDKTKGELQIAKNAMKDAEEKLEIVNSIPTTAKEGLDQHLALIAKKLTDAGTPPPAAPAAGGSGSSSEVGANHPTPKSNE
ncbi:MAG: hypothetical protein LBI69_04980 [Puniceicoccales bacterium]|jgi:hypothetical protein|nr:hypothetical protein [Puniceicoccales bacterium]